MAVLTLEELRRRGTYRPDRHAARRPVKARGQVRAPRHLSREARRIWRTVAAEWEIDAGRALLLQAALEAYDRMREVRAAIVKDGLTIKTSRGTVRVHPALRVEAAARSALIAALKALGLQTEGAE